MYPDLIRSSSPRCEPFPRRTSSGPDEEIRVCDSRRVCTTGPGSAGYTFHGHDLLGPILSTSTSQTILPPTSKLGNSHILTSDPSSHRPLQPANFNRSRGQHISASCAPSHPTLEPIPSYFQPQTDQFHAQGPPLHDTGELYSTWPCPWGASLV
jgi:hypothetical protein